MANHTQGQFSTPTANFLPPAVLVMEVSQRHGYLGSMATDTSPEDLTAAQGYFDLSSTWTDPSLNNLMDLSSNTHPDPTSTEASLDPQVADISRGYGYLGSMAADTSLEGLIAPQGYFDLDSTGIDPALNDLVALSSETHLDSMLTEESLDTLVTEVLQGQAHPGSTGSETCVERPTTRDFENWKKSWDRKMLLVRLKREGREWEHIIKVFWRMDKTLKQSGWRSMWERSAHDIDVLGRAARVDRDNEVFRLRSLISHHSMVDAARIDYEGVWDRISELMGSFGTESKWNAEKVEYAWTHGVSTMFPDIVLRPRQFSRHLSAEDSAYIWAAEGLHL
ncbi:hypothetical protein BKA64DRAFT_739139 [Cadophora sp. MPI-SDFR-AT-0126]|nr:hypothetical protein BKA64DRAFT_739139 [Leotiomycetes sp. MPI-SDFR-AT-0126]